MGMEDFTHGVINVVKKIPRGQVMTYKEVAEAAGRARAYRAMGNILHKNYDPKIPCHRVIRSGGSLGGYNRGVAKKRVLLKAESGCIIDV